MATPKTIKAPKKKSRAGVGSAGESIAEAFFASKCKALFKMWRIPNDFQVIRRRKFDVVAVPKRKSGPDYMGIMRDGWPGMDGRNVAIEVKNLGSKRLANGELEAPRLSFSYIEDHQLNDLIVIHKNKGISAFLVVHGDPSLDGTLYLVPSYLVFDAKLKGAKSLKREDLAPYAIKTLDQVVSLFLRIVEHDGWLPTNCYRGRVAGS